MTDPDMWELSEPDFNLLNSLPVCGCGRPELAYEAYRKVLATAVRAADRNQEFPSWAERIADTDDDERLFYVVAYVLDDIEATEHGGNISGAWATDKGSRLLALLDQYAASGYDSIPCMPA